MACRTALCTPPVLAAAVILGFCSSVFSEEVRPRTCQRLEECDFSDSASLPAANEAKALGSSDYLDAKPTLLVLIGGLVARLYPETTWQHVVAPAVRDGFIVDVAIILTMDAGSAQSSFTAQWLTPQPNPRFTGATPKGVERVLVEGARQAGARRVSVQILEKDVELRRVPAWVFRNRRMRPFYEGSSLIRPVLWNFLARMKKIEMLWNRTVRDGPSLGHYDHVVWSRSDAIWVDDLRMEHFPHRWKIYSRPEGMLCGEQVTSSINDQVFVLGGLVASVLLTGYSSFYKRSPLLDESIDAESFLFNLAAVARVPWVFVPPESIPFGLGLHMKSAAEAAKGNEELVFCLRESLNQSKRMHYCQDWSFVTPFLCYDILLQNQHGVHG